jgi:hypothetical protein
MTLELRAGTSKNFEPETWEANRLARFQIAPLVELFHRSVPALRFLKWTIEETGRGSAVTRLPLNVESSNSIPFFVLSRIKAWSS